MDTAQLWWTALDASLSLILGVAVTIGGGKVVELCFRRIDTPRVEEAEDALPGGSWIGALERVAIYSALLAGWKEVLPVVVAVKGLARYPELRAGDTPAVAERFIIGTFVSILQACGAAALMLWIRSVIP